MRTEPPSQIRARRGRRSDDVGTTPARELGREMTDTTGRSVDQHALPCLQRSVIEQPLPRAQRGQRDGRALLVTDRSRFRRKDRGPDDDVLGRGAIAIEVGERPYWVADGERSHIGSDGGHLARELVRRGRRKAICRPSQLIGGDRRCVHTDERFAGSGLRRPDPLEHERLRPARFVEPDRPHLRCDVLFGPCHHGCPPVRSLCGGVRVYLSSKILAQQLSSSVR